MDFVNPVTYCISGIIHRIKVSRITFFTIVREKTFAIQAISHIKIPAEIKKCKKTFTNASRLVKFANFFFRGRFPIYGTLIVTIFQSAWAQLDISPCSYQSYSVIRSIDSTLLCSTLFAALSCFV